MAKENKPQKKKKGRSVQDLMGIKTFTKYGLATNKGELLFYLVSPTNISVLSAVNIEIKVRHLMMVLSAIPDIEITCTDSFECFDDNKAYLQGRLAEENNPKVRRLLKKDMDFLDSIQVEMAMCQYELPRLMHASDHWSRQAGGRNKGKGEQQLALDKRALQRRITSLKRELAGIQEKKETQRRFRQQSPLKKIALVGYTNAGKSTVLNHLLMLSEQAKEKQVLEQDLLFATLDTNVRLIQVKGHTPFLLSDTVGFLEHLPKPLLAAFDATLKEAQKADLLLHIIDISDPQFAIKREVTIQTLQRIGCAQLPCMEVYNKVDLCSDLQEEKRNGALYISAHSEEGMRQLLTALDAWQWEDSVALSWRFAYDQQRELSSLYTYADIETRMEKENGIYLQGKLPSKRRSQFRGYECEEI